jgi:hypothetical protein
MTDTFFLLVFFLLLALSGIFLLLFFAALSPLLQFIRCFSTNDKDFWFQSSDAIMNGIGVQNNGFFHPSVEC